jgi:hypothetical protein
MERIESRDMKAPGLLSCVCALPIAALVSGMALNLYDYKSSPFRNAYSLAGAETYSAEPFCAFEGVWHNWEADETLTLGCLELKDDNRQGSYHSSMGNRATSNFSMNGTYDIDSDSRMHVVGKDVGGKTVKFSSLIYADDSEYPTQMIFFNGSGERATYIWKRKD